MKTLKEKYVEYRDLYYKYFVWMGDATKPGTYIPLSRVDLVNGLGEIGDGTINFAELLTLEHLLNRKGTMYATAFTRLVYAAKNYFKGSFITNKTYDGFFVRDDINPLMAEKFNLECIDSMAYNTLRRSMLFTFYLSRSGMELNVAYVLYRFWFTGQIKINLRLYHCKQT